MKQYWARMIELYDSGIENKTEIARTIINENNLSGKDPLSMRKAVAKAIENRGIVEECEKNGIPIEAVNHYWYKGKNYSIHVNKQEFDQEEFIKRVVAEVKKLAPKFEKVVRKPITDAHCLVFDPADIHIGKLCSAFETGEEYNSQIAVQRVMSGLNGILEKAQPYNIDKIIFIAGNDILHIDNPKRTTTSGTPQDTDGMWYDNFIIAKKLLINIISTLMEIADVEVVYNPSNHDFMSGFMLLQCVEAYFDDCENVTFKNNMTHRKYSMYGQNLIGTTHMDGAKSSDLPLLMAHESGAWWHECQHRYIYGHHVHHKTSKDYMSVCVETLRSPSGTDSWHHRNGYQFSPKAVEAFIHHPNHGQIARLTHLF